MMTNPHILFLDNHSNSTSMSNRGRGDNSISNSNSIRVGREGQDDDTNDGRDYDHRNGRDYDINMDGVFDQDTEPDDDNGKLHFLFKMIFTLLHFDLHLFFNSTKRQQ
jgi:hypothetical protein